MTSDNFNDFLHTAPDGPLSDLAITLVRATNAHVKWAELDSDGYGVLDVTTGAVRMDWYFLTDRTKVDTAAHWALGWSVSAGSSKITSVRQL